MPRKSEKALERKHVHLTEGSWDELDVLYAPQGITPSNVIRRLVDFHLKKVRERITMKLDSERATDEALKEDIQI